jgi:riboflavin kinase/FMN adenylyltransferase
VEIVRDPGQVSPPPGGCAVTIGVYDGVHLGHQSVIRRTQEAARRLGVCTALVTFDPHPARVLRPETAPKLLTDLDQKLELLAEQEIDATVVIPFDEVRAAEVAEEFVEQVIVGALGARAVVVGGDFHFGKNRGGNTELLTELGRHHGFEVDGVTLLPRVNGTTEPISSTAIRRALAGGEVATAAKLLGRHHEVRGPVAPGDQRGRAIGFPTANVVVDRAIALPADAVYAGWYLRPDGVRWPAAINIGKRPTFHQDAERSLLEAHLIGFDGDLYGERARVQLVHLLRSEQRFDGIDALAEQLRIDVRMAKDVLDTFA